MTHKLHSVALEGVIGGILIVFVTRRAAGRRGIVASVAAGVVALLALSVVNPSVAHAATLVPVVIDLAKVATPSATSRALAAGDNVTFDFTITCSSTQTDCVNLTLTDSFPQPLTFVSVNPSPRYTISPATNGFSLAFQSPLDGGGVGLIAGETVTIQAIGQVRTDVDASFDGKTITNTAYATVDNPDSNNLASANVLITAPAVISSSVSTSVSPTTLTALPSTPVSFQLGATNTSNTAIDQLVIQDPGTVPSNAYDYLSVASLGSVTFPSGANRVQVDWYNGSVWTTGTPATTATLPAVSLSSIKGLRFSFTATTGQIARGATAAIAVNLVTTAAVAALATTFNGLNIVSSTAQRATTVGTTVTANAPFTITPATISPVATKAFSSRDVIGGQDLSVTLGARNGGNFTLSSLAVTEPTASTTSFADQGLQFAGWNQAGVFWPVGATAVNVSYYYSDSVAFETPITGLTRNAIPVPTVGRTVTAFIVTFTGSMPPGQYATLPYLVHSLATPTDATTTNTITVDAVTTGGLTASATATDTLTRRNSRVNTTVNKLFTPSTFYANSGASTLLSLQSSVAARPTLPGDTGGSTVGATSFVITDVDPTFWDSFDASAIVATEVPVGSRLTVRYSTDGGLSWIDLPGAVGVTGAASLTTAIPTLIRSSLNGLQFTYTSTTANPLPPGFNVQPNIKVVVRSTLRSNGTPVMPVGGTTDVVIHNIAGTTVTNPDATPTTATSSSDATVTLHPSPSNGSAGYNMLVKTWQNVPATGAKAVQARSAQTATVSVNWGTAGLEYNSVVVSDTADNSSTSADDPSLATVGSTVYEAFDLVRIPAITAAMDPLLAYDAVRSVEGFSASSHSWVALTGNGNPCVGSACYGTFPGYTLTAAERADTIGVRLVFTENPNRTQPGVASPTAPLVGSGVAATIGTNRQLDLQFQLRDVRRSNGAPVLGATRLAFYNTAQAGEVNNTSRVEGRDSSNAILYAQSAADQIQILDTSLNVTATKSWVDGPLGVPVAGTPAALYPIALMTVTAQNTSVVPVNSLQFVDPAAGTNPFDYVNLVQIERTDPTDTTSSVTLTRGASGDMTYTIAQAIALTSAQLQDVTAVSMTRTGRVPAGTTIGLQLHTQLRSSLRGTGSPMSGLVSPTTTVTVPNTVQASVTDPGGTTTPSSGTDNVVTDQASASLQIAYADYGVVATKSIAATSAAYGTSTSTPSSPAIQYDGSSTNATVTLTGQPTGNVRTTTMVIEDTTPTFWNAYNLVSFPSAALSDTRKRAQVDVLLGASGTHFGTSYTVAGRTASAAGTISSSCTGDVAHPDCWVLGTPQSNLSLPALPSGAVVSEIRGIRVTFTNADGSAWERPYNPVETVSFTVDRRQFLVAPSTDRVPSTLFTSTVPAPGETTPGVFSDATLVTASAAATGNPSPLWTATAGASAQVRYQHLPAKVQIRKGPFGAESLASNIPYKIAVTNTGGAFDKPLGALVITDTLPVESSVPLLVLPTNPDTGTPYALTDVVTYRLADAANATQTAPTITPALGVINPTSQNITFTVDPSFVLPRGWTLIITLQMQFTAQLDAGHQALNTATVVSDQPFDTCDYYTDDSIHPPQQTNVSTCASTTRVYPLATAPVLIVKGVRGVGAGPLDATGTTPLEQSPGVPYDDLGILKTIPTSSVDCSAPNVTVTASAQYYRYPCVPITRPGGIEEWASTFTNGGNIGLTKLVAIDVLPAPSDTGVIVNEARGSKWTPTLTTYPTIVGAPSGASFNVYYLTDRAVATQRCNGADIQTTLGMSPTTNPPMTTGYQPCYTTSTHVDDVANRNWQLLALTTPDNAPVLATIVALKFVVSMSSNPQAPGGKLSFVYRSRTAAAPAVAEAAPDLANQSIAYNSIAAAAAGLASGVEVPNRFVTEPRKVGVALATGSISLQKVVDGAGASYSASQFALGLACTSVGSPVAVLNADGTSRLPILVTKNAPTPTVVQGLPLYSSCVVSEANYGQSARTITPTTVIAQAPQTAGAETIFNPHPAFGIARPAVELSTVTNSYALTTFSVTKAINTGGALNAESSGASVSASNLRFSAKCTFNNGVTNADVLSPATTTFGLNDGGTWTSPSIPVGSSCVVTETNSRGAQSTTYIATAGGVAGSQTTGTSVSGFVLGASSNSVAFTNNYGVADLTINKSIAGTWATGAVAPGEPAHVTGTFSVNVTCTRDLDGNAPVDTTFTGTLTFSAATTLTHTIHNIAQGSNCTITEPVLGSAGATSITQAAVVNNISGSANTRTVTNTFSTASLAITKTVSSTAIDSGGAPVYLDAPYSVSVACTFQSQPVVATGYTSGPMVLTFSAADLGSSRTATKTLAGLPSGANCSVTETPAPANATSVSIGWVAATSASVSSTTASFALATGSNTATVTNYYGVNHFTVQKLLKGAGAAQFGQGHFTMHVTCVSGAMTTWNGDITLPTAGGAYYSTITNLASGSVCSAAETTTLAASGADAVVYTDGAGTVTDGTGVDTSIADPRVIVQNWYLTGAVTVTKSIVGDGASTYGVGPFTIQLDCVRDVAGTPVTVTITNPTRTMDPATPVSMSQTFGALPRGAVCTLRETNPAGATSSRISTSSGTVSTNVATGYTFTVAIDSSSLTDNQPQPALTVENTFDLAALTVTKTVSSSAVDQSGTPVSYGPFATTVDCTFEGRSVYATGFSSVTPMLHSLVPGTPWLLFGLPAGAACSVTEDSMDAASSTHVVVAGSVPGASTSGATSTLTLGALGTTNSVGFTNSYSDGSLWLSKVVDGVGRTDWGTANFTVQVTCLLTDATGARTVWNKDYTLSLTIPGPIVLDHVAAAAVCTVTETTTGGATATSISVGGVPTRGTTATAVIAAGVAPSNVVVTNTFDETQIDVTKLRTGAGASLYGDGPFESTLSCSFNGSAIVIPGGATRALEGGTGYVASYTGLPVGSACAISETKTGGATSTVVSDPTLTTTGTPYAGIITNDYAVGSLAVAKSILGDGASLYGNGPFTVTATCSRPVDGATVAVTIPGGAVQELNSGNGYSFTYVNLPAGANCSVAESNKGFATTSVVGAPVTIPANGTASIGVTNTFVLASVRVTNKVTGNDAARNLLNVYVVHLSCRVNVAGAWVDVAIPGGADRDILHLDHVDYTNLPAGATCSLTETVQHAAQQVHITIEGFPFQLTTLALSGPTTIDVENVYNVALAYTGLDLVPALLFASQLTLVGFVLLVVARRRRRGNSA